MMLLPASMVQWGTAWDSSKSGNNDAFKNFMQDVKPDNHTSSSDHAGEEDEDANSAIASLWVEIGCSVFKAQLVRNVTLM
jgi:hypothetical protein